MHQPRISILLACGALAALLATPTFAQPSPGKISGTVRVASGAPVAGAPVTIMNQETGATRVVRSSSTGTYEAAGLPPALYTVSADVQGFRKVTQRDQRLAAGGTLTIDFSLEVKVSADVTVTAMKREDTVASVPVSVAAPTEDVLRDLGATNIEDVAANVPGLSVQNLGPGQSEVAIRGVSSGQIARDLAGIKEQVGSYLDESVMSLSLFTPDIDLFDVNRVEVLRGPQGTLFGSGSLSGTVRYISNKPELGATKFFGEFTGAAISGGNASGDVKMGFNLPLGDVAALRVAGYFDHTGGYMDAVQPNLSVKKDVNTGDRAGVRAAIEIAPGENLTITPRFVYQNVKTDGWNRIDIFNILANPYTTTRPKVTLGERELFTQINEPFTDKFLLADLNVRYNFGDVALTSITSYTHRDILVVRDAGALTSSITGGTIGLPESVYTLNAPLNDSTQAHGWTEELRLSSDKGRFKWVVGGFYADSKRDYKQDLPVTGFEAATGIPTTGLLAPKDSLYFSTLNYKLQQYAFFGEGTFAVTDRFSVTAGLRYYHFKEDKELFFDGIFANDFTGKSVIAQPGSTKCRRLRTALHPQLQAGRLDDPERPGLEGLPAGRDQRPDQPSAVHTRGPCGVRRPRLLQRRDGLELRGGLEVPAVRRQGLDQRVGVLRGHQRPPGHRDGGIVLVPAHLQHAEGPQHRGRAGVRDGADPELRLRPLGRLRRRPDSVHDQRVAGSPGIDRHRGGQSPAERAEVPGIRVGYVSGEHLERPRRLRDGGLPARRLALHAACRPGAGRRHREPAQLRTVPPPARRSAAR